MTRLLLKWGTVKGWEFADATPKEKELLTAFLENSPMSCAMDKPDERRKTLLCELIDVFSGEIKNDWSGEIMTKDEAKQYVMEYGK
jgi:hypothetical protein